MQLRSYQQDAITAVYRHLRERDDNPVVVIPTAGGKTPILATICRDAVVRWNGRVLVVSHVKELLEQAVGKLKLVCPELPVGVYSAGLNRRDTAQRVIVAGIQSIYKRARELDAFDLIVVDECFIAGTRVLTPAGEIPIEQVQPGMFVRNATGIGEVEAVAARLAPSLVTLEYHDGTTLSCTATHPIFTDSGWRAAGTLELGSLAFGIEAVRMLRQRFSALDQTAAGWQPAGPKGKTVDEAAVLFDLLCQDSQQLHDLDGSPPASQRGHESKRSFAPHPRRKRAAHEAAAGATLTVRPELGGRIQRTGSQLQSREFAEELEDRPCPSRPADCAGVGRTQSQVPAAPTRRFPQDALPGAKRLVRITHHKPAGGRIVFNLHVSGHPSYYANGVLVHNCHLIPSDGDGMYRQFLADAKAISSHVRVIGLTATPFRLDSGSICASDHFLNAVCYEIGVKELIRDGYLCPLVSKASATKADTSGLHVRAGEFVADEVESLMDADGLVEAACAEIVERTQDRQACLIFAAGVKHGSHVARVLQDKHGVDCGFVCGDTPAGERDDLLSRFRGDQAKRLFERPPLKYLCNVNVLTTGFDAPNIDCVVLLRPTMSPGLYYQMVGRGFRLHPGKKNCLVLDFGGNLLRHGPVDQVQPKTRDAAGGGAAPAKECPQCHSVIAAGYANCPDCGHAFPPPERQVHESKASEAGVLSGQVTLTKHRVSDVYYTVHTKRDAREDDPQTMRVDYRIGWHEYKSEWVCFEHAGFARQKAIAWWKRRSPDAVPDSAERAVELAQNGAIANTISITVRSVAGEPYDRIVDYELGPLPEPVPAEVLEVYEESSDELPF